MNVLWAIHLQTIPPIPDELIPPRELDWMNDELGTRFDQGAWEETEVNGISEVDCLKLDMALLVATEP